ncbi:hypothetical protein SDC9_75894 [bioreactor metagenome]|uniref:Uncharacterized protein n=1 Tax=bioreactor metagenome TaxID=1076179 RepID=A0A644YTH5_9ZZZZ
MYFGIYCQFPLHLGTFHDTDDLFLTRSLAIWKAAIPFFKGTICLSSKNLPTGRNLLWFALAKKEVCRYTAVFVPRQSFCILETRILGPNWLTRRWENPLRVSWYEQHCKLVLQNDIELYPLVLTSLSPQHEHLKSLVSPWAFLLSLQPILLKGIGRTLAGVHSGIFLA